MQRLGNKLKNLEQFLLCIFKKKILDITTN